MTEETTEKIEKTETIERTETQSAPVAHTQPTERTTIEVERESTSEQKGDDSSQQ